MVMVTPSNEDGTLTWEFKYKLFMIADSSLDGAPPYPIFTNTS